MTTELLMRCFKRVITVATAAKCSPSIYPGPPPQGQEGEEGAGTLELEQLLSESSLMAEQQETLQEGIPQQMLYWKS